MKRYSITYLLYLRNFIEYGRQVKENPYYSNKEKYSQKLVWYWLDPIRMKLFDQEDFDKHQKKYPNHVPLWADSCPANPRTQWFLDNMVKYGLLRKFKTGYKPTALGKQVHLTQGFGK